MKRFLRAALYLNDARAEKLGVASRGTFDSRAGLE
jgi:hypothetical protein